MGVAITGPPACANRKASAARTKANCLNARIIGKVYVADAGRTSA